MVDAVEKLNSIENAAVDDPEIATRISQYEMAFAMQSSVPELMDLSKEPKETLEMYGTKGADGSFAANCLLARRLAERGVRFIQLYHRDWDHHGEPQERHQAQGRGSRQRRGGPDHRPETTAACSTRRSSSGAASSAEPPWPRATAAITTSRASACGWRAAASRAASPTAPPTNSATTPSRTLCEVHDLHATMLYLLGIDHKKLTYKFQGRDFRLTDVHGNVVQKILA